MAEFPDAWSSRLDWITISFRLWGIFFFGEVFEVMNANHRVKHRKIYF